MDSTQGEEPRRKAIGRIVDAGALAGLLLMVVAVAVFDRYSSADGMVDLVFILDQRYGMKDVIDAVKSNCIERAAGLESNGLDCRFAVIPFGGKRRPRVPLVPLQGDLEEFKRQFLAPPAADSSLAASGGEAVAQALAMDFRKDATVLYFVISQVPFQPGDDLRGIAARMDERGITVVIQANAAERLPCLPLYEKRGRFYSMAGEDLTGPGVEASRLAQAAKSNPRATNLLSRLAPDVNQRDPSQRMQVKGVFALRTAPNRSELVEQLGGTQESEQAVRAGLDWLSRHQADDGHWSDPAKCEQGAACGDLHFNAAVAETGLAVLAFQAGGNYYFNDAKYSERVTRGLDWLVGKQRPDGCLFGPHSTWYEHGIATFALAEACGVALANNEDPDPRYLSAARLAVKFIEEHQYAQGGWRYDLNIQQAGDASVSGWQVLALKSALEAQIDVSPETMQRVRQFYENLADPNTGTTGYTHRGDPTDLTTAVGLIVQEFILNEPHSPLALKAVEHLQRRAAAGVGNSADMYTLYNGTLAMFLARGAAWRQWNGEVRDAIVKRQEKQGCARGSWHHQYRRTLDTAWAVLALEVYYRYATE